MGVGGYLYIYVSFMQSKISQEKKNVSLKLLFSRVCCCAHVCHYIHCTIVPQSLLLYVVGW